MGERAGDECLEIQQRETAIDSTLRWYDYQCVGERSTRLLKPRIKNSRSLQKDLKFYGKKSTIGLVSPLLPMMVGIVARKTAYYLLPLLPSPSLSVIWTYLQTRHITPPSHQGLLERMEMERTALLDFLTWRVSRAPILMNKDLWIEPFQMPPALALDTIKRGYRILLSGKIPRRRSPNDSQCLEVNHRLLVNYQVFIWPATSSKPGQPHRAPMPPLNNLWKVRPKKPKWQWRKSRHPFLRPRRKTQLAHLRTRHSWTDWSYTVSWHRGWGFFSKVTDGRWSWNRDGKYILIGWVEQAKELEIIGWHGWLVLFNLSFQLKAQYLEPEIMGWSPPRHLRL